MDELNKPIELSDEDLDQVSGGGSVGVITINNFQGAPVLFPSSLSEFQSDLLF